jgi:hypothetical protein
MTDRALHHPDDDRLLELAYGEVPASEARSIRQHVDGCPRCRDVLDGIAEVRSAVRAVPHEPPPDRGLESLLAYGEQAAARARARRRGVRFLGVLSVAAALGIGWVLLPRAPSKLPDDALARVDLPAAPEQGDRAPSRLEAPAPAEAPFAAESKQKRRENRQVARGKVENGLGGAVVAAKPRAQPESSRGRSSTEADALKKDDSVAEPPLVVADARKASEAQSARSGGREEAVSNTRAFGSATDEKEARAGSGAPVKAPAREGTAPRSVAAVPPAAASAYESGSLGAGGARDLAAKLAVLPPLPADGPAREARLAEVVQEVPRASGDTRKGLLLEQCRLEAALDRRASAVGTCSRVAREYPGTPEARQAVELARGFSVQPPPR